MIETDPIKFGLNQKQFKLIKDTIFSFNETEKVIIFGSRATGKNKESSDIDLAIFGQNVKGTAINRFAGALEDLPLPFTFDVIDYRKLTNEDLKRKIDTEGKLLFEKQLNTPQS